MDGLVESEIDCKTVRKKEMDRKRWMEREKVSDWKTDVDRLMDDRNTAVDGW